MVGRRITSTIIVGILVAGIGLSSLADYASAEKGGGREDHEGKPRATATAAPARTAASKRTATPTPTPTSIRGERTWRHATATPEAKPALTLTATVAAERKPRLTATPTPASAAPAAPITWTRVVSSPIATPTRREVDDEEIPSPKPTLTGTRILTPTVTSTPILTGVPTKTTTVTPSPVVTLTPGVTATVTPTATQTLTNPRGLSSPSDVLSTKHNLGSPGKPACNQCHAPHNARGSFLWSRAPSTRGGKLAGVAGLCYSCHDGSVGSIATYDSTESQHQASKDCILCHDPHSKRPDFLR